MDWGFVYSPVDIFLSGVHCRKENKKTSKSATFPSSLLGKILRSLLVFISFVIALSTIGLDLTSFALLGGAVGVGIGFGLQKVVSNLVSGLILLIDRSIKPGDVIEIEGTYGWINSLRARYASVITRDGKEHLIPNEDLITNRVINWSFSDRNVRVRVPVGISYDSNPRLAIELCLQAAKSTSRTLMDPEPKCLLTGFGDNSIDLELRFWIDDPSNGVGNVRSAVLLSIWDKFNENNIEIPYPQRDVRIRNIAPTKNPEPDNKQRLIFTKFLQLAKMGLKIFNHFLNLYDIKHSISSIFSNGSFAERSTRCRRTYEFSPMILIFVAFYFLLIAPQRKKQKQHDKMIASLEKGAKVKTVGGVFGTITGVKTTDLFSKLPRM